MPSVVKEPTVAHTSRLVSCPYSAAISGAPAGTSRIAEVSARLSVTCHGCGTWASPSVSTCCGLRRPGKRFSGGRGGCLSSRGGRGVIGLDETAYGAPCRRSFCISTGSRAGTGRAGGRRASTVVPADGASSRRSTHGLGSPEISVFAGPFSSSRCTDGAAPPLRASNPLGTPFGPAVVALRACAATTVCRSGLAGGPLCRA